MYQSEAKVRVRYAETDQMGYCYYGNYATFYEVARVDALRKIGISYNELEKQNFQMPVLDFNIKYIKPAYYDEELTILCKIPLIPKVRIKFDYESYNQKKEMINFGSTTLVFIDKLTKKPVNCPKILLDKLNQYI
jgi:acyl-CoA thioester hydrolase